MANPTNTQIAHPRFSFQLKAIVLFLLLINAAIFAVGYLAKSELQTSLFEEKQEKLLALAKVLDNHLAEGGYDSILEGNGMSRATRDEKVKALNRELAAYTDKVASTITGVGLGYYSRELDAIITYGPSKQFGHSVGTPIAKDHPGRDVMRRNQMQAKIGKMVRGEILNIMQPIERGGHVIGYIWSNELMEDINEEMSTITMRLTLIMIICSAVTILLVYMLTRGAMRDVGAIIEGVRTMRKDLGKRINVKGGELGEMASNINALAEDIGRATADTKRAVKAIENIMNNVPAMVYVVDLSDMRIVYANRYMYDALGTEKIDGEICHKVIHGRDTICHHCCKHRIFDKNGEVKTQSVSYECHLENGNRDFHVTARLMEWHDGRTLALVFATDVTQQTLLAAANASNEAQRDFLARMSHEIRTPMNGVLGMVRLALLSQDFEEQRGYIKKIESSATILLGIINGILDFSRLEAGKMSLENITFDLRQTLDDVCALIQPSIREKGLDLRVDIAETVPQYVRGDRLRLSQIFLNLLGNSVKFTLKGHVDLKIYAHSQKDGRLLLDCTIADTGIGMTEEQQEAIFSPFVQADSSTSRKFGGTGLGLPITKALVELMGGEISVRSEQGWGTEFAFYVEIDASDTAPTTTAGADISKVDENPCAGRHYLVVEDNLINQEIAVAVLTEMGAKVDVANNGEEGLQAFLNNDYDTIFMDMRMPVMDGLEATRQIRASHKHDARTVYIVAMTANVMQEDKEASLKAGMNGHVGKPLDMTELLRHLH